MECNPFKNTITFIYNVDAGESEGDSYKAILEKKLQDSDEYARLNNGLTGKNREFTIKEIQTCQKLNKYSDHYVYYNETDNRFFVNHMAYLNDCFSYDVQKENYLDGIMVRKQLENSGFNINEKEQYSDYEEQLECIIKKEGFSNRMKRYCEYRRNKEKCQYFIADAIMEQQYEDLKVYYDSLGYERIKALGYKEQNLKNEIKNKQATGRLYKEFRAIFPVGTKLPTPSIKSKMEEVYSRHGINQKGVASHLKSRFGINIKPAKISIDGSRKNGYEFI